MSRLLASTYETPFGELSVVVSEDDGTVRSSGLRPLEVTIAALPAHLRDVPVVQGSVQQVDDAVQAWVEGDGTLLTSVPAAQDGSPFFQSVWQAMRQIPAGTRLTYGQLAEAAGKPRGARSAGSACAQNNLAPFVPCHRVVRSGGEIGNYGFGGAQVKLRMLELEGAASGLAMKRVPSGR